MSNWKVGPGGRLYHPTTGAYVGQLDDNGNEQMVLSALPSGSGWVLSAAGEDISSGIAVQAVTAAQLAALPVTTGKLYQITDLPGQPLYKSNGSKYAPLADNTPWIALTDDTSDLTHRKSGGQIVQSAPGRIASQAPTGGVRLQNTDFVLNTLYPTVNADLSNYQDVTGVPLYGLEVWSPNGAEVVFSFNNSSGIGAPGSQPAAIWYLPAVAAGAVPNKIIIPHDPVNGVSEYAMRFSIRTASSGNVNARLLRTKLPYNINPNSTADDVLTGNNSAMQFNYLNTSYYPADTDGILLQVCGSGTAAYWSDDGGSAIATKGKPIPVGAIRYIDFAQHGIQLSNLFVYLATGQFLRARAIKRTV